MVRVVFSVYLSFITSKIKPLTGSLTEVKGTAAAVVKAWVNNVQIFVDIVLSDHLYLNSPCASRHGHFNENSNGQKRQHQSPQP